jgi:hypothetical protein
LYSHEIPLVNVAHTDFIELVFRLGVRPDRPEIEDVPKLTDSLWTLAENCWFQDPKARPTTGQIHALLVEIISEIPVDSPGEALMTSPRGTEISNPNHNLPDNSVSSNKALLDELSSMSELASTPYMQKCVTLALRGMNEEHIIVSLPVEHCRSWKVRVETPANLLELICATVISEFLQSAHEDSSPVICQE